MPYYPDDRLPLSGGTMTGIITSTNINPLLTPAESWIGPSSTTGIYFKGGLVAVGNIAPVATLDVTGTFAVNPGNFFTAVDSTAQFVISGTTAPVYISLNPGVAFFLRGNVAATAGATAKNSVALRWMGERWNGSASTQCQAQAELRPSATIDNSYLAFGFTDNDDQMFNMTHGGRFGVGLTGPTAIVHIKAGTATASTAPLKFTSGTLNTTAEAGAQEFLTDDFFATITTGAARKAFVLDDGARLTSGKIPIASTNGRLIDGQTPLAGTKIYYVADSSGGAVTRKLTFIAGILTAET